MIQCAKCGMQNVDGGKFCRFCGNALMQSSGDASRRPYSWQSEEFQIGDRTQPQHAQQTRTFATPPPPPQMLYPPNAPHTMQPVPSYPQQYPYSYGHNYCPNCRTQVIPNLQRKIAPAGWIVFAVLLITFFPLFWLGFFIKEDRQICPICGTRIG